MISWRGHWVFCSFVCDKIFTNCLNMLQCQIYSFVSPGRWEEGGGEEEVPYFTQINAGYLQISMSILMTRSKKKKKKSLFRPLSLRLLCSLISNRQSRKQLFYWWAQFSLHYCPHQAGYKSYNGFSTESADNHLTCMWLVNAN